MTDMSVDIRDVGPLHEALAAQVAAEAKDEEIRQMWKASEERHERAQRAALRTAWAEYHTLLARNHQTLADEHHAKATKLLGEVNGNGSH